jgi:hypothetical protein
VKSVADALLSPGESFFDASNRNALYFYLDRRPPVAITSVYNSAPRRLQQATLDDLGVSNPPLILVDVDARLGDGISLPLRAHSIYRHLVSRYVPFRRQGHIYAVRADLAQRVHEVHDFSKGRLPSVAPSGWPAWVGDQMPGKEPLTDSETMDRIQSIAEREHAFESAGAVGQGRFYSHSDVELWAEAFHVTDLGRVPSAWGRSVRRLGSQLHTELLNVDIVDTQDLERPHDNAQAWYRVTGKAPQWRYKLPMNIDPQRHGILSLNASCAGSQARPKLQVFWSAHNEPFTPSRSVRFEASFHINLVPVDSSPRWSLASAVEDIRIDLLNPDDCKSMLLGAVQLGQRR